MSNSALATYRNISPSKTSPRNHIIDTITIHCMAGQMTAKACADMFAQAKVATSSNYCIGYDGQIAVSVDEADRSWCSSNRANDLRAITIEVASDSTAPYAVKDAAYTSLIELVTDICKRNGIEKLVWANAKTNRINHKNGCNMTVHRDYAQKNCPGDYLYSKMPEIAEQVNSKLVTTSIYRVRKTWTDSKSQVGAYKSLDNAKKECDQHPGYSVYDNDGTAVYASASYTIHTVVYGDTLWKLAVKYLGDGNRYDEIKTLNGLKSNMLNVGQKLKIPVK